MIEAKESLWFNYKDDLSYLTKSNSISDAWQTTRYNNLLKKNVIYSISVLDGAMIACVRICQEIFAPTNKIKVEPDKDFRV